jgi:hypothetical protein
MSLLPLYSSSAFGVTTEENLALLINLDSSGLGPTSPLVANAVRHLCGLFLKDDELKPIPIDDYYAVARDYYERIGREDKTGVQALSFLSYVSAYFHEIRHVHDLLATNYGQTVLFKNLNYYQNLPTIIAGLAEWQARNRPPRRDRRFPQAICQAA